MQERINAKTCLRSPILSFARSDSEKDKKRIKDAIEQSAAQVKIDLTEMAEKQKKIIYSVAKGGIDEATLDKLCEIIKNKETAGK